MQELKKSYALLCAIFLFSSCGSLPKKPLVEICANDVINNEVECYDNQSQSHRTLNYSETDRYIMFSSVDWGLILLYIDRLKRAIKSKRVKSELYKIQKTSNTFSKRMRFKK